MINPRLVHASNEEMHKMMNGGANPHIQDTCHEKKGILLDQH